MPEGTNVSYRYGVEPDTQGAGFSENSGDDWVFPQAFTEPITVFDDDGLSHTLVICNNDGLIYDISGREGPTSGTVEKIHKDKVDTDGTGGTDVVPEVTFPEDSGTSERFFLEHLESHIYTRPYKESNRDESGYDSNGYPTGLTWDWYLHEDGNPTKTAVMDNVPFQGDISSDRQVEAHTIYPKLIANMGDHIITGRESTYKSKDKTAEPDKTETSEMSYQETFADPVCHIGNVNGAPMNLAIGVVTGGTYGSVSEGPDGQTGSAVTFTGSEAMTAAMTGDLSGDCTIQLMVQSITAPIDAIKIGSVLTISITESGGVYSAVWNDGTTTVTQALSWTNSGWVLIEFERSGTDLIIREGVST